MNDDFEAFLDQMIPGAGARPGPALEGPGLPAGLQLEPRGLIGRGGSGWVYLAYDPVLAREVAVKVAAPQGGEATRKAVLDEARISARINHPAVVPVHRVVVDEGLLCVIFRAAPRDLLSDLLEAWRDAPDPRWPASARLALVRGVVDAVVAAHGLGLVHGDLKPDNIVVGPHREPYVLDWSGLTWSEGSFSGTATHAAPEQLRGHAATSASDVYSAAVLVWEALTLSALRRRLRREDLGAFVARAASQPLPSMADVGDPALAAVLTRALDPDPARRPASAELLAALDGVITGRADRDRRRAEADALLQGAREHLLRFYELEPRLEEERRVAEVQRAKVPAHAPVSDKQPLWSAQDRAAAMLHGQSLRWLDAFERAVQAVSLVPEDDDAHRLLADLWWERLIYAENHGYEVEVLLCLRNLAQHDRGKYASRLRDEARLTLSVDAPGATLSLARLEAVERRLAPVRAEALALPLVEHRLAVGSWLATVSAPGRATVAVPLAPGRLGHLRVEVALPQPGPPGWVFVPAGPFRMGGDAAAHESVAACTPWVGDLWVAELPVSAGAWLGFLAEQPPADVPALTPQQAGAWGEPAAWPSGPGGVQLPPGWTPEHPVVGVTRAAAERYAAWLSVRLGRRVRLPTEEEWEKAARGVDGRLWPWGDVFDPAFCHMRSSFPGVPRPGPSGQFAADRSVYGVRDVAGGVRAWTTTTWGDGRVVVRGGCWRSDRDDCRVASRGAQPAEIGDVEVGVRLVMEFDL